MQTASRVVRGVDVVAEPTRQRVLDAVERLNYQPNMAARSLSAKRTGSVHIIDAVPLFHGHAATFVAVCQALAALDLHISTSVLSSGLGPLPLRALVPVGADAVVVLGGDIGAETWIGTVAAQVPTVYVGQTEGLPAPAVGVRVDHRAGALMAVEHLLERGATRIAHIAGPYEWTDASQRLAGYLEACEAAGLEPVVLNARTWNAASAAPLVAELPPDVDAVFAANDHLALGLMSALQLAGRSVPGDVRVVGFDDAEGSDSFLPALTTVRQDFRGVGEAAVVVLNRLLAGEPAEPTILTPTLVVRAST